MSQALRTSAGCLLILLLLALGACSHSAASPSPTFMASSLPSPEIARSPTPTRRPPTPTLPPTATPGPFREKAFPVQRIDESLAQAGIDFDAGYTPPSSGTYLFYITAVKPDHPESWDFGTSAIELRYVSIDAASRGRILSVATQPDLLMMSDDLQAPTLLMAWFDEQGATIRKVDLSDRAVQTWQAAGLSELYPNEEYSYYKVRISNAPGRALFHHAFSPDGHCLAWDCDLGGDISWCLLELRSGTARSVYPCAKGVARSEVPSEFNWSPASDRFLALRVCSPDEEYTVFLASLGDGTVDDFQWPPEYGAILSQQDFGWNDPAEYQWSPDGDRLFTVRVGDLQTGEGGAIYVVRVGCVFGGSCDATSLVRWAYDWRGLFRATFSWSPRGDAIGLAEQPVAASGLPLLRRTSVGVLDLGSGVTRTITDFAPEAAHLLGWSPDGDWMVMACSGGKDALYALCGLSMDGLLRGLVPAIGPDTGFGFIGFAGWWVIP